MNSVDSYIRWLLLPEFALFSVPFAFFGFLCSNSECSKIKKFYSSFVLDFGNN